MEVEIVEAEGALAETEVAASEAAVVDSVVATEEVEIGVDMEAATKWEEEVTVEMTEETGLTECVQRIDAILALVFWWEGLVLSQLGKKKTIILIHVPS